MTKMTAVAPGGDCQLWREFLKRVTGGNAELEGYLQRLAGYCLTGSTREHALFFLYGTGANGKSVFINTVAGVMGDYARTAPIETFTETRGERHPTDLAWLRGARLVVATETEEGRRWAEAKIKTLTGGDRIAARHMRQDFFEYTPSFKLLIAGNHKPHLRTVDEAVRRRFHMIPFTVTIPPEERDELLPDKLRAEWAGILAWMIEGAVEWGGDGLRPPTAVRDATDAYLRDQDIVRQFIEDCCVVDENKCPVAIRDGRPTKEAKADLDAAFLSWAAELGIKIESLRWFGRELQKRGCEPGRDGRARYYKGIALTDDALADAVEWRKRAGERRQGQLLV
jgi:putative DNA primase/helicase